MRGALMIGSVIVLLIVGALVIKNMGADTTDGGTSSDAKRYVERAEDVSKDASERIGKLKKRLQD